MTNVPMMRSVFAPQVGPGDDRIEQPPNGFSTRPPGRADPVMSGEKDRRIQRLRFPPRC